MTKFKVIYEHDVTITYKAIVEAESIEEAKQKISDGDIITEEEYEYQGMYIRVTDVKEV